MSRAPAPRGLGRGVFLLFLILLATPLLSPTLHANGGTVRVSRAPLGPYRVTIYTAPTPLRTGELDVSVMVQDSADVVLDLPIRVEARPLRLAEGVEGPEASVTSIAMEATRAQATNKLFKAAKFDVEAPGEWEFEVTVAGAGSMRFSAPVARTTIWDRPYLLATLILMPLAVVGWLALGGDEDDDEA